LRQRTAQTYSYNHAILEPKRKPEEHECCQLTFRQAVDISKLVIDKRMKATSAIFISFKEEEETNMSRLSRDFDETSRTCKSRNTF
jgi:hypothetical protein